MMFWLLTLNWDTWAVFGFTVATLCDTVYRSPGMAYGLVCDASQCLHSFQSKAAPWQVGNVSVSLKARTAF